MIMIMFFSFHLYFLIKHAIFLWTENVILQEKEEMIIIMSGERHNQQYSNRSDFRSTWVHPRFVVGFVLLDL
jgi:hypothetical protein